MTASDRPEMTDEELDRRADDLMRAMGFVIPEEPIADTPQARLRWVIPLMRKAAKEACEKAKPGVRGELAVLARNVDGSGVVGSGLDLESFFADVEAMLNAFDTVTAQVTAATGTLHGARPITISPPADGAGESDR